MATRRFHLVDDDFASVCSIQRSSIRSAATYGFLKWDKEVAQGRGVPRFIHTRDGNRYVIVTQVPWGRHYNIRTLDFVAFKLNAVKQVATSGAYRDSIGDTHRSVLMSKVRPDEFNLLFGPELADARA
eukprot:TRINITY_DN17175_c0_g1_i2.p2 TRINITY_DN17175_c0_g1~~TRINITY_DN17175_c0_g1_i2.p2  ORF type:complete len:128 (+),score=33.32 TRINITY_DN17175_c0_g1_i2:74-457(+)